MSSAENIAAPACSADVDKYISGAAAARHLIDRVIADQGPCAVEAAP